MSQHDHDIANQTFPSFRSDLNNALGAILTNNSGNSAPTTTSAYMWWVDTTNTILKMRNGADSAWLSLMASDGSAYYSSGSTAAAPAYSKADDTNTGVFFPAADTLSISTAGSERIRVNSSGNVLIGTTASTGTTGNGVVVKSNAIGAYNQAALSLQGSGGDFYGLNFLDSTGTAFGEKIIFSAGTDYRTFAHRTSAGTVTEIMTLYESGAVEFLNLNTSGTDNGTIKWNSTTGEIWADSSSKRFKENIIDIELDSSLIYQLEAKQYNKKGSERTQLGYIAEQVADIIPVVVGFDKDKKPFNINYEYLTVPIIEEMKKLKSGIDKVEDKIDNTQNIWNARQEKAIQELKEKVKALESKVN